IELGRLFDRDVGGLRPAQNLVDDVGHAPELVRNVWSIGQQTTRFNVLPKAMHRRQSRAHSQDVYASSIGTHERVTTSLKCIRLLGGLPRARRERPRRRAAEQTDSLAGFAPAGKSASPMPPNHAG